MFVWIISTEHFVTKLGMVVWWYSIMSWSVARAHMIKIWLYYIFWTADSLGAKLGLMVHHHKPEYLVKKKKWITAFKGKVTVKTQNVDECFSGWYLLNCQTFFFTKLMFMHHHEPECQAKRLVCYLQGQGHSKGSYDQYMTVRIISSELLILFLPNLVWWYIIKSQSVLWRNVLLCSSSGSQQNVKMFVLLF